MTIYLYVKTHNVTGLKYLGKTEKDPFKYNGSGKYWVRHLKRHGYDIKTEILLVTESKTELKETGIFFSKLFDIVKSEEWANLTEEKGDGISSEFSSELQRKRISEGDVKHLFTTANTIEHNKKMLSLGIHPSQRPELIKETNRKMLENGTHPFKDPKARKNNSKAVSNCQIELSKTGKHNFKNKIPVIDKIGVRSIISKDQYNTQKIGIEEEWEFVSVASREARNRRNKM